MRTRFPMKRGLAALALLALAAAAPAGAQTLPPGAQAHLADPHIVNPFVGWYRANVHPPDRPPYKPSGGAMPMTSFLANILVNNPSADGTSAQDTQSETSTLVFGTNVLVGYNDSTAFTGFTQSAQFTGYSLSTDGGNTFTDEGTLPANTNGDLGDPSLAADQVAGTIYFSTLPFGEEFGVPGIQIFRSYDGGATFQTPVNGGPGFSSSDFLDKDWITVDNASGAGQGTVYSGFTDFGPSTRICITHSTDGGNTWGPSGGTTIASGTVQGTNIAVGPDHSVYVFWLDGNGASQAIMVRKSTDGGNTFASAVTVATLKTTGVNGDLGLGGFRSNAFPMAVVNPISGNVYVAYNDQPGGNDRADVFFAQSTDGGNTWSVPVRVNDDTTTNDQWQPAIAVSPDGTQVFIGFYDRRLDSSNYMIDTFGAVGVISGSAVTFQPNFRITSASFPPVFGVDPVVNSSYMGDYDKADSDNAFFYYSWGDNRLPSAGHSGNNADVRITLIPISNFYISSLSPNSATAGGPGFTLTVNGNNFQNGATLSTSFVSSSQLTASVPASDIASPGIAFVTVTNPDGTKTGPAPFSIKAPAITSLSPSSTTAGGPGFTLTVNGSNYLSGATVNWNGSGLTTTFVSGNQLTASVPASDIAVAGTAGITVTNPSGATSSSATFTIDNPVPSTSSLNPASAYQGYGNFTLTVKGSGFVSGSVVNWNGTALPTTYVSSSQLTASVPSSDTANVGTASVTVVNPAPGGGTSNAQTFTITAVPAPVLASISPTSVLAGGPGFTLTLNGSSFLNTSYALWTENKKTTVLTTSFVSSTQLSASVPASLIASAGSAKVVVSTPGAGTSSSKTIKILQTALSLSVTSLVKNSDGSYTATISLNNIGYLAANNTQITSAKLGLATTSTPLPVSVGNIPAGSSGSASLSFPAAAGASGKTVTLKVVSSFTGGTSTNSIKVKLP